jgi:hypothetical protein
MNSTSRSLLLVWAVVASLAFAATLLRSQSPRPQVEEGPQVEDVTLVETIEGNRVYRVRDGRQNYLVVVKPDSLSVVRTPGE